MQQDDLEFMNEVDIVNDLLTKLHIKDRELIKNTKKHELLEKFPEWSNHIRNFYSLYRTENPLTKGDAIYINSVVLRIMETVWDIVHLFQPPAPISA